MINFESYQTNFMYTQDVDIQGNEINVHSKQTVNLLRPWERARQSDRCTSIMQSVSEGKRFIPAGI